MKRSLFSLLLASSLLLAATPLAAQTGQTGLSFLKLGVGARPLGMGEAYMAAAADPAATYYNPAALSTAGNSQLLLMHKEWIQDVTTDFLAAMTSFHNISLGLGINATSVNDIELRTTPGPPISTFSARNTSVGLSASYLLTPEVSIGLTGKFLYEKILVDDASGFGFDMGVMYRTPWNLRLAAGYFNMGSVSALDEEATSLPRMFRAGAAYSCDAKNLDGTFTLASDVVSFTGEGKTHLHAGGEFEFRGTFAVRAGYQTGYDAKNFSAGVGLREGILRFDYAFVPFRYDLGTTHTFSLGISFE
jgi:hypothetical protein